jgi:hypothetical protein
LVETRHIPHRVRSKLGEYGQHSTCNQDSSIVVLIIHTTDPDNGSEVSWRDLIETLTGSNDTVLALGKYLSVSAQKKLDRTKFTGHYHCEGIMRSPLCAASSAPQHSLGDSDKRLQDVFGTLSGAKPVIGVSKRCCHVCHNHGLSGPTSQPVFPILDSHQSIT